jgi:MarR family transcriptional regulator, organic hydroperoxide resistance regulator
MDDKNRDSQKQSLGHLLAKVSRLVGARMRTKLEAIGLHHAQGMILFHLWKNEGMAQNRLAQALHITPPTTTSTLQRMEREGWIERRRDKADQRVVRVYLTDKAKALRREIRLSFQELDRELTSVLSMDERNNLTDSLGKVYAYLSRTMRSADPSCRRQGDRRDDEKENR